MYEFEFLPVSTKVKARLTKRGLDTIEKIREESFKTIAKITKDYKLTEKLKYIVNPIKEEWETVEVKNKVISVFPHCTLAYAKKIAGINKRQLERLMFKLRLKRNGKERILQRIANVSDGIKLLAKESRELLEQGYS